MLNSQSLLPKASPNKQPLKRLRCSNIGLDKKKHRVLSGGTSKTTKQLFGFALPFHGTLKRR